MKKAFIVITLLSFVFFLGAGTAGAALTTILPGSAVPLLGTGNILETLYGAGNFLRVDDAFDQIWFPADGTATATAKYAFNAQNFGYIPLGGSNSGVFQSLFTETGSGYAVSGTGNLSDGNVNFRWVLQSGGNQFDSQDSQNGDVSDHMVTWLITGGSSAGNYAIAWEDMLSPSWDQDFNDLVVEVTVAPIPIPGAVWLLGSGLIGIVGIRRKLRT